MIDSDWVVTGSVVIGDQRALVLGAELPVEPDRRGQGQQPLGDPGVDPGWGAAAVLLQTELAFEGVDNRLDPLAHRPQAPEPGRFVAAVGPHQHGAQAGHLVLDRGSGQALVDDEDLPRMDAVAVQQRRGDLPLAQLGAGQAPGNRAAVGRGEDIQLEAPVPARVAGTPAVIGPPTQRRPLDRLTAGRAGDRGGVQQPEGVLDAGVWPARWAPTWSSSQRAARSRLL